MSSVVKIVGVIFAIGLVGSMLPDKDNEHNAPRQAEKKAELPKVDYLLPLYTRNSSIVCPLDILFDRREGSGLVGASKAAATVFGRSEAVKKAGCQEWREGQRMFVPSPEAGEMWQRATPYENSPAEYFVLSLDLTNNEYGK